MSKIALQYFAACGIPVPVAEHRFHPERKWRFDFAWPNYKVALEVEGGVWMSANGGKSRHFHGAGALADMEKYNTAAALGWRVLKVPPDRLLKLDTFKLIKQTIETVEVNQHQHT